MIPNMSKSADGVTPSGAPMPATRVRALGAAEHLYSNINERTPVHFVIAAEYPTVLTQEQVASALRDLQARHPLLAVQVEDHPGSSLGFYRPFTVPAVELTVWKQPAHDWQQIAANEMERRFESSTAPLIRATLISDAQSSTILLTFNHTIADGMASVSVLKDLTAVLNGHRLDPLPAPPAKEELVARALPDISAFAPRERPTPDPLMTSQMPLLPLDGTPPQVRTDAFDKELTARIVQRCRVERTSVHTALVAAASRVRSLLYGEEFVRAATLIDVRGLIGAGEDCGAYFRHTRTGMSPHDGKTLWDQARLVKAELATARSTAATVATTTAIEQFMSANADPKAVESLLASALSTEVTISNLRVVDMEPSGPIHPTAIWGPVAPSMFGGEVTLGITTFESRLRVTAYGNMLSDDFLPGLRETLSDACREDRKTRH